MPNGGTDCCGTCPFNGVNKGEIKYPSIDEKDFFCEIRGFKIQSPFWTYCNNHPKRNPLRIKEPRGPIWAAILSTYNTTPLRNDLNIPFELLPPEGDSMYIRIPYFDKIRPYEGSSRTCEICGKKSANTISIKINDKSERIYHFCSSSHYFEWWLNNDPLAISLKKERILNERDIILKLRNVDKLLPFAIETFIENNDMELILNYLKIIDEILLKLGFYKYDTYTETIKHEIKMPKTMILQLIDLKNYFNIFGNFLSTPDKEKESIIELLDNIAALIKEILNTNHNSFDLYNP